MIFTGVPSRNLHFFWHQIPILTDCMSCIPTLSLPKWHIRYSAIPKFARNILNWMFMALGLPHHPLNQQNDATSTCLLLESLLIHLNPYFVLELPRFFRLCKGPQVTSGAQQWGWAQWGVRCGALARCWSSSSCLCWWCTPRFPPAARRHPVAPVTRGSRPGDRVRGQGSGRTGKGLSGRRFY